MARRTLTTGLTVAAALVPALGKAESVVLGEVSSVSAIGEPLRIEIRAHGPHDRIADCVRVRATGTPDDGITTLKTGKVGTVTRGGETRIVVTQAAPVFDPVLRLGLEDSCGARLHRDYTLLLSHPENAPAEAHPVAYEAAAPVQPAPPAAKRFGGQSWTTAPGETLETLAQALYPKEADVRRRFVAAVMRENADLDPDPAAALPPGTELKLPDRFGRSAPPPARVAAPSPARAHFPKPAPTQVARETPKAREDRLVVGEKDERPSARRDAPDQAAPDSPDEREARLVASVDRTITTHMELMARIRRLEEIQAGLMAQLQASGHALPAPVEGPQRTVLSMPSVSAPPTEDGGWPWGYTALLAALAATGVLAPSLRKHRLATSASARQAPTAERHKSAPTNGNLPLREEDEEDDDTPIVVHEIEATHAHQSAIQLAEMMLGFGRRNEAVDALADFIRAHPREAVTPWLKLLELYRAVGLRTEFDALSRQLNKVFNVRTVSWDTFEHTNEHNLTVEQTPHVLDTVQRLWGTRECQIYLEQLLRDNRDGTRVGFPIAVIDEILLLAAILEQQIGPYSFPGVGAQPPKSAAAGRPSPAHTGLSQSTN